MLPWDVKTSSLFYRCRRQPIALPSKNSLQGIGSKSNRSFFTDTIDNSFMVNSFHLVEVENIQVDIQVAATELGI